MGAGEKEVDSHSRVSGWLTERIGSTEGATSRKGEVHR